MMNRSDAAGAPSAPWACTDCGARGEASGDCARCGQGPRVDLREANVREVLIEDDRRRAEKRGQQFLFMGIVLMVLGWLSVGLVSFPLMMAALSMPGGLIFVVALAVGAVGVQKLLLTLFPPRPRFPYLYA